MRDAPWSLRHRIVLAYTCYAVAFVLFFALITVLAVEGIETHLVDHRLREAARWSLPRYRAGMPVEMPAGMSFHFGPSIPRSLRHLGSGVHDVEVDGVDLHVLSGTDQRDSYVVVDHQSDYDKVELAVYSMFGLGFLGFIGLSFLLAGFVVRGVVTPVTELAMAVSGSGKMHPRDGPREVQAVASAFASREAALEDALRRERFFTGDVSHELRTNLTIIMGAAELLAAQHPAGSFAAPAQRVLRAAQAATDTVGVLLQLARAPAPEQWDVVEINVVMAAEVQRAASLVRDKPVQLLHGESENFTIRAPRVLCQAAIWHLLRVACDTTAEGSISIRHGSGELVVEDTGSGLPAAVKAALQASDTAVSSGSAGTGFGLGLVQRICEYLHCTLRIGDRPGGGTVYVIAFDQA